MLPTGALPVSLQVQTARCPGTLMTGLGCSGRRGPSHVLCRDVAWGLAETKQLGFMGFPVSVAWRGSH